MAVVYLGLGSNRDPGPNLRLALRELARRFQLIGVSAVYRNKAVGFDGDEFLNAVACIETGLSATEVTRELEEIHDIAGRRRGADSFISRTLDIDLLLYDQEISEQQRIPRADVLQYSFVLRPLAEIAPGLVHPVTGKTMAQHWSEFDESSHLLAREDLTFQES